MAGAIASAWLVFAPTVSAAEPTKDQCVEAYRKGQELRRRGAFQSALEPLMVCGREPCPAVLQPDCLEWLRDAQARVPSIVVKARSGSNEVTDVQVAMDGKGLATRLDGHAIEVDAGEHRFAFARAGAATIEQTLLIAEGEKGRIIEVDFPASPSVARPPAILPEAPPGPRREEGRSTPWSVYGLGGLGLVSLGVFATFGTIGVVHRGDLSSCKPGCSQDRIDGVSHTFAVADVSLVIGAVALAGAGVIHLLTGNR